MKRYTYETTTTACPPDDSGDWRLAHVVPCPWERAMDGLSIRETEDKYIWERDALGIPFKDDAPPLTSPGDNQ